jgi:ABC-2 type transport system ATP-binding protein
MKGILGTIHLDGGNIDLFGQNTSTLTDVALASLKERVGFVSAVTSYPVNMTVRDVARTYELAFPRFSRAEFERLATSMELLPSAAGKRVHDLSRGMGMKLQLACVLATGADLLIMDEPTAGLDPIVREEVLDLLRTWMEDGNKSILISSHITSDLSNLADYLAFIDDGQLVLNCGRDDVDAMGVAHLRTSELETVRAGSVAHDMPALRHDLSYDLLVPDRAAFLRAYPDYICDRASIDDVMVLLVKGEVR